MNSSNPSPSGGGHGSADSTTQRRNSKQPNYSRFTQQELLACKPILTPKWVIATFLVVSVVFIPIGVVSLLATRDVVEIVDQYEIECIPEGSRNNKVGFIQSSQDKTCNRTLNSRSDQQLRSRGSEGDTDVCKPEDKANGFQIIPCGLIAWSLFNNTYGLSRNNQ